jgi:hypothetical protein
MSRAEPLGLRLFLEGIEVPVISASIQIQPKVAATAAIQIVPTNASLELLPRTMVHLFFLDRVTDDDADKARKEVSERTAERNLREFQNAKKPSLNRYTISDENYRLAFCGEAIGFNYTKNAAGTRSMVLQCMDLSSYWDTCYQWFADYSVHGNAFTDRMHVFVQAGSGLFDNITKGHQWVLAELIRSRPKSPAYRNARGLLGGMINIMEAVGGVRNYVRGVNDFFTIAELRYKLMSMLGAVEGDKTAGRLYNAKAFRHWLLNGMTSMGNLVSFRQIINHVGRWVFHDVYPNPAAYYTDGERRETTVTVSGVANSKARELLKTAHQQLLKAQAGFASASLAEQSPMVFGATRGELTIGQIGATGYQADFDGAIQAMIDAMRNLEQAAEQLGASKQAARIRTAVSRLKPEMQKFIGPARTKVLSLAEFRSISSTLNLLATEIATLIGRLIRARKKTKEYWTGEHLFNQLLIPETYWMPPPRCNVLFPDQYTEFSFNRNFAREVSRLSCGSGLGWLAGKGPGSKILSSYYFAPNTKDSQGKSLYNVLHKGARTLLPHETHSGIIPKMEWVSDGHRWGVKAAKASDLEGRIGYVQRIANFQFFYHRWSARTINVSGPFNPRLVLGFPALIIDKSAPSPSAMEEIEKALGKPVLPTQFLGKVMNITHNINQQGGVTVAALTQARTHRGTDDEFLGTLQYGIRNKDKFDTNTVTTTIFPKKLAEDPKYEKANRKKYIKILQAVSKVLSRQKSVMTRAELLEAGVSEAELATMTPMSTADQVIKDYDGKAYDDAYYLTPERLKDKSRYQLTMSKSLAGENIGGVGVIRHVGLSETAVVLNATQLASIGVKTGITASGELSGLAQDLIEVEASSARKPTFFYFPERIEVIFTEVKRVPNETELTKTYRIEDILRPGWYDDAWFNENIGDQVYQKLLGCGSVVDDQAVWDLIKDTEQYKAYAPSRPPDQVLSVAEAVDGLSMHYALLKEEGRNVHEFIRTYSHRPIATLTQILGSPDFDPDRDLGSNLVGPPQGIEGFHTRAFGDYNVDVVYIEGQEPLPGAGALDGLVTGAHPTSSRIGDKGLKNIATHLDPRGRARQRVRAYMAELNLSRGLQGS